MSSSARSQSQLSYSESVPSNSDRLKENVTVTVRFRPLRFCFLPRRRRRLSSSSVCWENSLCSVDAIWFRFEIYISPREIRQGDEVAWYADGDTIVRNEHNPSIAYAYGTVCLRS